MPMRALAAVLVLLTSLPAWGATFVVPDDKELVERSAAIVRGEVTGHTTRTNASGRIETVYDVRVERVLKGNVRETVIQVASLGGNVGQRWLLVPGAAHFATGDRVLLFLTLHRGAWTPTDLTLGKFRFVTSTGGQSLLLRDEEDIVGFDKEMRPHVERIRRETEFLAFITDTVRGRKAEANYFVSPKETVALKSDEALFDVSPHAFASDTYAMKSGVLPFRWAHQVGVFGASVPLMTAGTARPFFHSTQSQASGPVDGGVALLQSSLNAWINDCGSYVNTPYGGTNALFPNAGAAAGAEDQINTVIWNDPQGDIAGTFPGTSSVVGTCFISGGDRHTFDTRVAAFGDANSGWVSISDADVVMQNGVTGNEAFADTALMHEIGHGIGLRHSNQNSSGGTCVDDCTGTAIMNSSVVTAFELTPQTYDQNAIRALYPLPCAAAFVEDDFNGDGRSDIVWRNTASGDTWLWQLNSNAISGGGFLGNLAPTWVIPGTGDFNGDAKADLVWQNSTTGDTYIWLMNGSAIAGGGFVAQVPDVYSMVAVGDFNGDGRSDLVWRHNGTGDYYVWHMNGAAINGGGFVARVSAALLLSGIGDFNDDGRSDILWRNTSTGDTYIWEMNGTTIGGGGLVATLPIAFSVAGVGDFNGDGRSDIIWRNSATGNIDFWYMNGTTIGGGGLVTSLPAAWTLASVGDYNGDGRSDLVWRNTTISESHIWLMNGSTIAGGGFLAGLSRPYWEIAPYY